MDLDALLLTTLDLTSLNMPITEEIWGVIKTMLPDKAPGPDKFTGKFYKVCWGVIKGDLMRAVDSFSRGDMRGLGAVNTA